jgi:Fe-S oxidoreductase/nitrate reductase gamma subunit
MVRTPYWNIEFGILIDAMALPLMALFCYGLYQHWKRIRQGRPRPQSTVKVAGKIGPFFPWAFLVRGIIGSKLYAKPVTGIAHGLVFWGMVLLFIGTVLVIANVVVGLPVFKGGFNYWFMSASLDAAGLGALIGLGFLAGRRLLSLPRRLVEPKPKKGFLPISALLGGVLITGFLVEGFRIAANGPDPGSFVGNVLATAFTGQSQTLMFHKALWWIHGIAAMAFIAYIPFSPLVHVFLAPINAGLADPMPGPKMGVIDFSSFDEETEGEGPLLGVAKLGDFTRKRLLDFSTCLWCGRCHEVCPAAQTGKPLSPKGVLIQMVEHLNQGKMDDTQLIETVGVEAIFNCTTCAACMEACPVCINQPKIIMKFRQNLVMEQSIIPELMGKAHASIEQRQHPFFGTGTSPKDWRKGLDVPVFTPEQTEYLLWIGCAATYEERAQKIARAMVQVLQAAEVSFGILEEARCTGDPAKQMGNEFLFTEIAQQNIEEFNEMKVKKIITLCPHCYNSFTRHYPKLGGNWEVIPHVSLISQLMDQGRLRPIRESRKLTYHDPCYLGRRNRIFDEPRRVVSAVANLSEMVRHGAKSFCCGAGGGNYWAEETGDRINQVRSSEALNTDAEKVITACPFCLLMLTDGVKKFTEEEKVIDIAELVSAQLNTEKA